MSEPTPVSRHAFASDNAAGVCPEAWSALSQVNPGYAPSYGDDASTAEAKRLMNELFETECDLFLVFNGTASNALALSACCRSPYTRILCHAAAHVDTDECGAPEFFTGGAKLTPIQGEQGKLSPAAVEQEIHRGHGVHYPKPGALTLTQSTELGTIYRSDEIRALTATARAHGLPVHMDGARFANAVAALRPVSGNRANASTLAADMTWRAGIDVLSFGGTKNGMLSTEAVVFFNRDLAKEFEYRVKQGGQLASKMRFASAQWSAMLREGAWLRHAEHANAMAQKLATALRALPDVRLCLEPEVNGVFVELSPKVYEAVTRQGWILHRFICDNGYRLMCSWATTQEEIDAFACDLKAALL